MTPAKPSLELLRSLTDEHVLRALMDHRALTRAEIATRTGLSKPTASESARRLTEVGLLRDTGERTSGRGRIGSYYALAAEPGHRAGRRHQPDGRRRRSRRRLRAHRAAGRRPLPDRTDPARRRRRAAQRRPRVAPGALQLAVVSAADPSTAAPGGWSTCPTRRSWSASSPPPPSSPPSSTAPSRRDNDVNWAARAEQPTPAPAHSPTSPSSTSAKGSAARSSATARSAADTTACPGRSRTW